MPVVGLAEVLVEPVFTGSQNKISREVGPAATKAGRSAGKSMGREMAQGLAAETPAIRAEVDKLGKATADAESRVAKARKAAKAAAEAEAKALANIRIAQQKLQDSYASGSEKQAQAMDSLAKKVEAAQRRIDAARAKAQREAAAEAKALGELEVAQKKLQESYAAGSEKQAQAMDALVKKVEAAQRKVEAARLKSTKAADNEAKAIANLEVAHTKLQEIQAKEGATQSQLAAAAARVEDAQRKVTTSTELRTVADRNLSAAIGEMTDAQQRVNEVSQEGVEHNSSLAASAEKVNAAQRKVAAAAEARAAAENNVAAAIDEHAEAENRITQAAQQGSAQNTQLVETVERLNAAQREARDVAERRAAAEANLATVSGDLERAQTESAAASARLKKHLHEVDIEVEKNSVGWNRLAASMRNTFRGRPIKESIDGIGLSSRQLTQDLDYMSQRIGESGTRGGRAFTRGFLLISAGLTGLVPLAGGVSGALLAAAGAATTLASSLQQLGGVAALAPAALIAVGAAVGTLRAAFAGMGEALTSAIEAPDKLAKAAQNPRLAAMAVEDAVLAITVATENAADARENAARRVADAEQALADVTERVAEARKNASRAIERAERREADAARDVLKAQRALNDARKEAAARVKEVAQELDKAQLKSKETALALQTAQKNYQKGLDDPASSSARLAKLQLNLQKAQQADETAKQTVKDLTKEQVTAKKEATSANQEILDAEQKLADARQDQADAIQARKDAQEDAAKVERDGARAIADAQRAITDAVKASEKSQRDSARAVEAAHRNLERTQLQQAEAARNAGEDSELAMSKLSPAAQEAARALLSVYKRLQGIQRIASEGFFTGFSAPLLGLADVVIPQLETGVGKISAALGAGAQQLMTSLTTGLDEGVLDSLLSSTADMILALNGAIDPLVQAFITLGLVGMPYMVELGEAIRDASERFNEFIQGAAADGSLNTWIDNGIQGFKDLAAIGGAISGIFSAWNDAARAGGIDVTLGSIAEWLTSIEERMKGEVFQTTMTTLFEGAAGAAKGLGEGLGMINEAFVKGAPAFAEFNRLGGEIIGLFAGKVADALANPEFGAGLTSFLENVKIGLEGMDFTGLTSAFGELLEYLGPLARDLGPTLVEVLTNFAEIITQVLIAADPFLTWLVNSEEALTVLIGSFLLTAAISAILTAAINVVNIASLVFVGVFKYLPKIIGFVGGALKGLWLIMSNTPIGRIITIIAALIGMLIWFFTETELGKEIVRVVFEFIESAAKRVSDWFQNNFLPTWEKVFGAIGQAASDAWTEYIEPALKWIGEGWQKLMDSLSDLFGPVLKDLKRDWDKFVEDTKKPIDWVVNVALNKGLIAGMNFILGSKVIDDIPWPPKGWRSGGYTGAGNPDEAAGIVHKDEFVFNSAATNAIGKDRLAAMMWDATHNGAHAANVIRRDGMGASANPYFMGNVSQIRNAGNSYYMKLGSGVGPWNFKGAARMWDGASGLKVRTGAGRHQGYVTERERGGGILGYATGTNIDMSPSWKNILGPKQRLTVAAHEAGHAIGLPHDTSGPSIMAPLLNQMAAMPTARDIAKLQYLYPGGSGKAGDATPDNPLLGLVADLIRDFRKMFPGGGYILDGVAGLINKGIGGIVNWVEDIKNGIVNIAGDVVDGIKDFFGVGATVDRSRDNGVLVRDDGGIIPPGLSHIYNGRGENEYAVTKDQVMAMSSRTFQTAGNTYNVELPREASVDDLISAVNFEERRSARGGSGR